MEPSEIKATEGNNTQPQSTTTSTSNIPFYNLSRSIKTKFREQNVRPLFMAWLCGVLSIVVVGLVVGAYEYLTSQYLYTTGGLPNTLFVSLQLLLAAIGLLGFMFFCIGVPIAYSGSLRGAFRIFVHLFVFFIVLSVVLFFFLFKVVPKQPESDGSGGLCPGSSLLNNNYDCAGL
ncbi:MAG TPA: hypothetical protein VLE69_01520 [Candidatus Saccharimonadales bacterium]|nr:hypothetical protein [Candidatus Saccharimonadales bacterium]